MSQNPLEKALATASTVQGANRAMEHKTTSQVRVLDRTALEASVRHNFGTGDELEQYVNAVLLLADQAAQRGDGVAIYENHDLGHPEVGERQYASFGSEAAQLESHRYEAGEQMLGLAQFGLTGYLPKTLPDIGGRINWRYQLVAIVLPGTTVTAEIDSSEVTGGRVGNSADHG